MFRALLTTCLFSAAFVAIAPAASAQVEPSTVTDESRSTPAPAAALHAVEDLPPRANPTMFGIGIASTSVGGVAMATGAALLLAHALETTDCTFSLGAHPCPSDRSGTAGLVVLVSGAVLVAAGVPMIVLGGKRARKEMAFDPVLIRF